MWWLYSLRKFEFEWNVEALPLNAVKTLKGKINDGVAISLVIGIDAAELGGHLAVSHGPCGCKQACSILNVCRELYIVEKCRGASYGRRECVR
jgi:hypothetical protein